MASNSISASVTLNLNGKDVVVKSDSLGKGMKFAIDQPVDLGSYNDMRNWLKTSWNVDIPQPDTAAWPSGLKTAFDRLEAGQFWIDILNIDTTTAFYQLGVSFQVDPALPLVGELKFARMGLVFTRQWISSKLMDGVSENDVSLKIQHGDWKKFNTTMAPDGKMPAQDTILIDSEYMTVTKAARGATDTDPDILTVTREAPASAGATKSTAAAHAKDAVIWIYNR